jgi:hypothetical protein
MTCALRWIGSEVREPSTFHGQNNLEEFLRNFKLDAMENQRSLVLDIALKATPAHWWGARKEKIKNWYQCKRLLDLKMII